MFVEFESDVISKCVASARTSVSRIHPLHMPWVVGKLSILRMYHWLYSMKTFHQVSDFWEFGWIIFSYFSAQMKAARFQKMRTFSVKSY